MGPGGRKELDRKAGMLAQSGRHTCRDRSAQDRVGCGENRDKRGEKDSEGPGERDMPTKGQQGRVDGEEEREVKQRTTKIIREI